MLVVGEAQYVQIALAVDSMPTVLCYLGHCQGNQKYKCPLLGIYGLCTNDSTMS